MNDKRNGNGAPTVLPPSSTNAHYLPGVREPAALDVSTEEATLVSLAEWLPPLESEAKRSRTTAGLRTRTTNVYFTAEVLASCHSTLPYWTRVANPSDHGAQSATHRKDHDRENDVVVLVPHTVP